VRDEVAALSKRGSLGRISSADYGTQLKSLADRQAAAEDALRKATETIIAIAMLSSLVAQPFGRSAGVSNAKKPA
jgi:hypothetical protein